VRDQQLAMWFENARQRQKPPSDGTLKIKADAALQGSVVRQLRSIVVSAFTVTRSCEKHVGIVRLKEDLMRAGRSLI
jgi:hypothetical protein